MPVVSRETLIEILATYAQTGDVPSERAFAELAAASDTDVVRVREGFARIANEAGKSDAPFDPFVLPSAGSR